MNKYMLSLLMLCTSASPLPAQSDTRPAHPEDDPVWITLAVPRSDQDDERDPGYSTYREGYALILKEKWPAARKKFQELIKRYPKSGYVDEASYWSAYALKQTDLLQALKAYQEFTLARNESRYFDDAVADMQELKFEIQLLTGDSLRGVVRKAEQHIRATVAPELRRVSRRLHFLSAEHARSARAFAGHREDPPDPQVMLKIEALHALGRQRNDEEAFETLRDVARNPSRPGRLRVVALRSLSEFTRFDPIPVASEIARTDDNPELRAVAVTVISSAGREKNGTVELLVDLYRGASGDRARERDGLLYAIAEIGNERAVDFLADLATNESDVEIRGIAIYCLGSIGGQRARAALTRIIRAE